MDDIEFDGVSVHGNKLTIELSEEDAIPAALEKMPAEERAKLAKLVFALLRDATKGWSGEGAGTGIEESLPAPKTELGRELMAARRAYRESGRDFRTREELDRLYDELRGRA